MSDSRPLPPPLPQGATQAPVRQAPPPLPAGHASVNPPPLPAAAQPPSVPGTRPPMNPPPLPAASPSPQTANAKTRPAALSTAAPSMPASPATGAPPLPASTKSLTPDAGSPIIVSARQEDVAKTDSGLSSQAARVETELLESGSVAPSSPAPRTADVQPIPAAKAPAKAYVAPPKIASAPPTNISGASNVSSPQSVRVVKPNGRRYGLIGGVIVVALIAVGTGGYWWQERAGEQARAEQLALEKQQLQEKLRLAEEGKAREVALRAQTEQERQRVEAELALAKTAPAASEPQTAATPLPIDAADRAKLLLSDVVPKAESDRRAAVSTRLGKDDAMADGRLGATQAQKIFTAAGITPADATAATARIEQAVLMPSSGDELETTLLEIEALPKLARGKRKPARSANDEGLRMMQTGRFEDATVAFNSAFSHDPADVEVLGNLSYAYLKNGQLAETLRISNFAVRESPRRAGAWNQLAVAHAQRGADWLAVRAFLVLYTLSGDQTKTRDYLNRIAADNADERVRDAAHMALLVLPDNTTSEKPSSDGFEFGKADLTSKGKKKLDEIVAMAKSIKLEVIIALGHTDRIEDESGNRKLSGIRAGVVKNYLVQMGIPANRVYTEGKGSSQPITKPDQCKGSRSVELRECLRPDRRVDIEIIGTKPS